MSAKTFFKIIVIAITFMLFFSLTSCSSDDNPTEPKSNTELIGRWKVSKMSWSTPSESGSYNQTQLDSLGFIWHLTFSSDKTAEQMTNIDGPTITQQCTWSTNGDVLTVTLKEPSNGSIDFKYIVVNNMLTLDWSIPSGAVYLAEFTKQ